MVVRKKEFLNEKFIFSGYERDSLCLIFSTVHASELEIKPTFEATFGAFSSGKSYNGENLDDERINWQEGHLKYGAKGQYTFKTISSMQA